MGPTRIFTVFFPVSVSLLPGCCTLGAFPSALPVPQSCLGQCLLGAPCKLPTPAALTLCTALDSGQTRTRKASLRKRRFPAAEERLIA